MLTAPMSYASDLRFPLCHEYIIPKLTHYLTLTLQTEEYIITSMLTRRAWVCFPNASNSSCYLHLLYLCRQSWGCQMASGCKEKKIEQIMTKVKEKRLTWLQKYAYVLGPMSQSTHGLSILELFPFASGSFSFFPSLVPWVSPPSTSVFKF